jgi:chemotaxis protein CheZ
VTGPPVPRRPLPPGVAAAAVARGRRRGDDSDDLQALFDSVVAAQRRRQREPAGGCAASGEWQGQDKVFQRVGQMARQLHDTLGELGYHELLESTVAAIPDTRDRLNYVASSPSRRPAGC